MPLLERMISDMAAVVELQHGHTNEFGTSRIYSGRVLEMQHLGYFGNGVGQAPGLKMSLSQKGSWLCSRRFSLSAFACRRIASYLRFCESLKFKFIN
jgi:hypothetical protein